MPLKPHAANAPGDFYVEDGCCITCGVPLLEAPEVFAWTGEPEESHCVVANQPMTTSAVDRTLNAMWSGEVQCIRYGGADADIIRRIVEMGHADLCDQSISTGAAPIVRSHVCFSLVEPSAQPEQVAAAFLRHFDHAHSWNEDRQGRRVHTDDKHATVEISWFKGVYHAVVFEKLAGADWHAATKPSSPSVGIGLSRLVEKWLRDDQCARSVRWLTEEQWRTGQVGRSTVI